MPRVSGHQSFLFTTNSILQEAAPTLAADQHVPQVDKADARGVLKNNKTQDSLVVLPPPS